ncbi:hypothetical protein B0O99DRAFT_20645 [Bisporella sp. PMI_857]|nr:hypothetical protein B0O99DRAFT_20645 [Bisporella sp. PMI_857]
MTNDHPEAMYGRRSERNLYSDTSVNESTSTFNSKNDFTGDTLLNFSRSPTSSTNDTTNTSSTTGSSVRKSSYSQLEKLFIPHRPAVDVTDASGQRDIGPRARYGKGLQRPSTHQNFSRGRRNSFREVVSDLLEKPARVSTFDSADETRNEKSVRSARTHEVEKDSVPGQGPARQARSMEVDRRNVNVHTYAGRHSNDWLFGGWGKVFRRKDK